MQITLNLDGLDLFDLVEVLHGLWGLDDILDNRENEEDLIWEISKKSAESGLHYYEVTWKLKNKEIFLLGGEEFELDHNSLSIISAKENPSKQEVVDFINNTRKEHLSEEDILNIEEITEREMFFDDWIDRDEPILR